VGSRELLSGNRVARLNQKKASETTRGAERRKGERGQTRHRELERAYGKRVEIATILGEKGGGNPAWYCMEAGIANVSPYQIGGNQKVREAVAIWLSKISVSLTWGTRKS